jgi:hypothetical protein
MWRKKMEERPGVEPLLRRALGTPAACTWDGGGACMRSKSFSKVSRLWGENTKSVEIDKASFIDGCSLNELNSSVALNVVNICDSH